MKKYFLAILFLGLFFVSCNDDDGFDVPENLKGQDFVWKAMNYWYFWQADVNNLSDTRDDNSAEYVDYLDNFSDARSLFESLKFSADDFSWFIPDVDAQLARFRGVSVSYGVALPRQAFYVNQQANNDIYIYINYVVPGSPATNAGLERGDLIFRINGQVLNDGNTTLLNEIIFPLEGESVTLGVGSLVNGVVEPKGSDVNLSAVEVSENPVHFSSIIEEGSKKIGYLVYNGFRNTYNGELNDAFEVFKTQGINELILDLRYNRGGSVLTTSYLASMIQGTIPDGETFARLRYNSKRDPSNGTTFSFFDNAAIFDKVTGDFTGTEVPINRLTNLNSLYVITSNLTASASEMIINGLSPSMNVILVGLTTTGKNEGSNTLVDAPPSGNTEAYLNVNGRQSNIGMQPITFQIFNSLGQSDYANGFDPLPSNMIDELDFSTEILPFGDLNEALLRKTLDIIIGPSLKPSLKKVSKAKKVYTAPEINDIEFADEMYVMPGEEKFLKY